MFTIGGLLFLIILVRSWNPTPSTNANSTTGERIVSTSTVCGKSLDAITDYAIALRGEPCWIMVGALR